jgi:hypothetical protein
MEGCRQQVGLALLGPAGPGGRTDAERPELVEGEGPLGSLGQRVLDLVQLGPKSGSVGSFQVLVCWKVIPRRTSSVRRVSRPMGIGWAALRRSWPASLRIDQRVKSLPSSVGRVVAVWMTNSSSG